MGANQPNDSITSVSIDSRQVEPGGLFVCLEGKNTDGNKFVSDAIARGARAILTQKEGRAEVTSFITEDPVVAMGSLAALVRRRTSAKVLTLSGTAGKTTLKESLKAIFSQTGKILATEKNHNNQIGMPLTIFSTNDEEDYWILEAGISHAHDMDELGAIAMPDMAIILNIGAGHVEGLGERGIAWHKARLLNYLKPGGDALISADYPELVEEAGKYEANIHFFSLDSRSGAEFKLIGGDYLKGEYLLDLNGAECLVRTPFMGEWGAEIALCAAAAAQLNGIDCEVINKGFAAMTMPKDRANITRLGNWLVVNDVYNANPLSMKRILRSFSKYAEENHLPLILSLGEMGELGAKSVLFHRELGEEISAVKPIAILWKGQYGDEIRSRQNEAQTRFFSANTREEFRREILTLLDEIESGMIIFKGSRFNNLEDFSSEFNQLIK